MRLARSRFTAERASLDSGIAESSYLLTVQFPLVDETAALLI